MSLRNRHAVGRRLRTVSSYVEKMGVRAYGGAGEDMPSGVLQYAERECDNHFSPNYRFIDLVDFLPLLLRSR
ncbi:hypothetical protein Y032_0128g1429 [Ancylostoma ceylanicum]|uniref:Uncharacterized protein n=1 Tax=Ancylostoma ceylanicum TaxID=53326 RepID=A0A016T7Y3_9BILA|nr:hypothetical protein Y032_0128g1429 [Ancylostoma ceylanicum]